jgi:hypothetical protein
VFGERSCLERISAEDVKRREQTLAEAIHRSIMEAESKFATIKALRCKTS